MKPLLLESLFNKVAGLRPASLLKKTPAVQIFKNTFFKLYLRATASMLMDIFFEGILLVYYL